LIDGIPIIGKLLGNVRSARGKTELGAEILMRNFKQDKSTVPDSKERRDLSDGLSGLPFLGGLFGKVSVHFKFMRIIIANRNHSMSILAGTTARMLARMRAKMLVKTRVRTPARMRVKMKVKMKARMKAKTKVRTRARMPDKTPDRTAARSAIWVSLKACP
jgi:hypothetical protein